MLDISFLLSISLLYFLSESLNLSSNSSKYLLFLLSIFQLSRAICCSLIFFLDLLLFSQHLFLFCGCNIFSHPPKDDNVKTDLEVFFHIFFFPDCFYFLVFLFLFWTLSSAAFFRCLLTIDCWLTIYGEEIKMYLEALNSGWSLLTWSIIVKWSWWVFTGKLLMSVNLPIFSSQSFTLMYNAYVYLSCIYVLCIMSSIGVTWVLPCAEIVSFNSCCAECFLCLSSWMCVEFCHTSTAYIEFIVCFLSLYFLMW